MISRGGVVFGAAFDEEARNVRHIAAESMAELEPLMKSKYVWSNPEQAYKDAVAKLKNGREVLFAGTPCQVAAIRKLAGGVDEKLLTIDIVCHGTPRADMFASYIEELEERFGGKCKNYDFRDKRMGWNFPRVRATFSNGNVFDVIMRCDAWYLGFIRNTTLRKSCFACPYVSLERVSDFTIADCWRVAATNPNWDDNGGTSLVFVNSEKAMLLWDELMEAKRVNGGAYDIDLAQMRNMPLMQRAIKPDIYDEVQRTFDETKSFKTIAKLFMDKKLIWRARFVFWVKRMGWSYFRRRQ